MSQTLAETEISRLLKADPWAGRAFSQETGGLPHRAGRD
jgi:hypothetical protein